MKSANVALVTGAGVRVGRAIAEALGNAGYTLALHCHRSVRPAQTLARALEAKGTAAKVFRADLSKGSEALKLAKEVEKGLGPVAVLVNSAAIFWPTPLERLNERELDAFLNVNLKAPYLLSAELGRRMKKRGQGCIVNIACVSAARPWKTYVPYSISKAGVAALTVGLAKLLGPEVRVNAVSPGTVLPPEKMTKEQAEALARAVPLQRNGTPADVAGAVLYLVQAPFVTGQVLQVDGGRSIV